ncbi:tetratricopeptide repeat protein [Magnetospirillum fulvum]|uniref:Uncharacterized protein n=1 Tax=Magnetospirillum fulvum MGU-K5 TaxID=1316936 RepID=S9TIT6_MAGFU|nr:hypothetical protein [Magnetospirillum fulvum]EPY02106.1 hypothetical protein K678_07502 [Magnetospirillum fulvum MGU-K5]
MADSPRSNLTQRLFRMRWGVLALVLAAALPTLALAQARGASSPRAADHDGYGRMVFDWEGPVGFTAEQVDGQLVVHFDKPIAGDPKAVVKPLSRYLKGASLSADRTTATFPLTGPVQIKTLRSGNAVVIDLSPDKSPPSPAPIPPAAPTPPAARPVAATATVAPPAATAPSTPAPAPAAPTPAASTAPAAPAAPATELMVRGGEHTGFNRLVFDWPKTVGYTVEEAGDKVTVAFDRPANLNVTSLRAALPPDVGFLEARPAGKGTAVVLSLPPGMRVRHFASGPRVALDLVRAAGAPPPPRVNGAPPPPLAPAPGSADQPPALKPLTPAGPATPAPLASLDDSTAPAPSAPVGKMVSLGFSFDKPTGAAVFRRAGWLWAVFDLKAEIDTKLLKRTGGDVVLHVEQISGGKGTAVRMLTLPGFNPSVRKEGQLWVLDIHEQPLLPKSAAAVSAQMDFQDRGRLVIAAADGSQPMLLRDPEVGDTIQVVTVPTIGVGVRAGRDYPGVELLTTAQGVAAVPHADGVRLDPSKSQVEVAMPGGLYLTPPPPAPETTGAETSVVDADAPQVTGPLDITKWMRGGNDGFVADRRKLLQRMAMLRPNDRNIQRLEIARHYLANGFAPEALGELRLLAAADPAMVETPAFRAARGAANFLARHDAEAIADLSMPALKDDPRVQLFLAAANARSQPDPARQALTLRLAPEEIKGWPRTLRMELGEVAARTVAGAGDGRGANRIIDAMMGPGLQRRDVGRLSYLGGLASIAGKQYEQAISRFRDAEASDSRPDRAYATRDRVELMLKLGKITPLEAIGELEKMRFAWRGEDFEFQLMKRISQLQVDAKRYGEGLRSMHLLAANYPDHPDIPKVMEMMSEAFARLFLDGEADKLPPVTAIGLYDEFQELTPPGAKGDEMIRRLADRLASVDLLERASDLLRHQVEFRLSGLDKARVGTRLAFLTLSDRKPGLALEALDLSEMPDIPTDLAAQRRYLRVQALDDLGRSAEALALIINDQSEEARRLRGEINWRLKKWPEAVAAMESTIEKPLGNRPLDPKMARRVLDTATAMTLGHDERGLARLRRTYGDLMSKTDLREAFDLLTSEPERGIADYRRIGDKVKQVEEFQTFMGDWKNRVKAEGLSSMN